LDAHGERRDAKSVSHADSGSITRDFWISTVCFKGGQRAFDSGTELFPRLRFGDKELEAEMPDRSRGRTMESPWALEMRAVSIEEPSRLVQSLTGAILGCGGWVLSRGATDAGTIKMLFEFERRACVDIYSVLIGAGVELSHTGHVRFTALCQCTRIQPRDCGAEIASIDLEIQTFPPEEVRQAIAVGGV
jgi:hypothetical protein